jgi:hypothetical protein
MPFEIFNCRHCPMLAFYTLGEFDNHRFEHHERPWPEMSARLEAESTTIGRARPGPWVPDLTHWHVARIQNRNGTEGLDA